MEITKWYQVDVEQAIKTLESDLHHGLNDEQVKEKRSKFGLNELEEEAGKSIWAMFFDCNHGNCYSQCVHRCIPGI
jgi:magnesium-transporting ATPase (P-type)